MAVKYKGKARIITAAARIKKAVGGSLWPNIPYAGEDRLPVAQDPLAGTWPLNFFRRDSRGRIVSLRGKGINWRIRNPAAIDFKGEQLSAVQTTMNNLDHHQITIAEYWNSGPPTKQWSPIIDRLIDTYGLSATHAARVLGAVQAGINDAFVVAWHFKYLWKIPRPNQLDQELRTICCTPYHPAYPSGHATISGCAEVILSYFFPPEAEKLKALAEQCAQSRLYAGVHFPADNEEGLRLGRQIGYFVVQCLKGQKDSHGRPIDTPPAENLNARLMPPPYVQAIPYYRPRVCGSLLDWRQAPQAR